MLVTVGLSLSINLLSSLVYRHIPCPNAVVVGLTLVLAVFTYLGLWGSINGETNAAMVMLIDLDQESHHPEQITALVPGLGFGFSRDASNHVMKTGGPWEPLDPEFQGKVLEVAECVLLATISEASERGWFFPGEYAENLNMRWIEAGSPTTGTTQLDLDSIVPEDHAFRFRRQKTLVHMPAKTILSLVRDENRPNSRLTIGNKYVTITVGIHFSMGGPPSGLATNPWIPRGKHFSSTIYELRIARKYHSLAKVPFASRRVTEHVVWAERLTEFLVAHLSFRAFERDEAIRWREKEMKAVECFLGVSRWD